MLILFLPMALLLYIYICNSIVLSLRIISYIYYVMSCEYKYIQYKCFVVFPRPLPQTP